MPSTLRSRQPASDGLVALFEASPKWEAVFAHRPTAEELDSRWPFLIVDDVSTRQTMAGEFNNPSEMVFIITSFVATKDNVAWRTTDAASKVRELDLLVRQIIRDNTGQVAWADGLEFSDTPSNVAMILMDGINYLSEMRLIEVSYETGA